MSITVKLIFLYYYNVCVVKMMSLITNVNYGVIKVDIHGLDYELTKDDICIGIAL